MKHSFDLLEQNWIPIINGDGTARELSLREALVNAHHYQRVSATLPHTTAALIRLMLALLHRVFGPKDAAAWAEIWEAGQFDSAALERYFGPQRHKFDLFDEKFPFFQQRHPLVEEKPVQSLLQSVGGGDTFTLFDHTLDDTPLTLTPAEAARMLVTTQAFGLAGLCHPQHKLVYNDAPCSRAIVFLLEGKNLFETLLLNLVRYNRSEPMPWREPGDRPVWEVDDPYQDRRNTPLGYLDYLTWPNRRILLIPEERDGQTRVVRVTTAPGLTLVAEQRNPMHHYRKDTGKKGEITFKVVRFSEGKALWRDSSALLDVNNPGAEPVKALTWVKELTDLEGCPLERRLQLGAYGMCTEPGKAKVYFYRGDGFTFDDTLLKKPNHIAYLNTAIANADDLRRQLWGALHELGELALTFNADDDENGRKPDPKDIQNLIDHWNAEGLYWNRLEAPFFQFLNRLPQDPEGALQAWRDTLKSSARAALTQTAEGLGTGKNALKAATRAGGMLSYGIAKVLPPEKREETNAESPHA